MKKLKEMEKAENWKVRILSGSSEDTESEAAVPTLAAHSQNDWQWVTELLEVNQYITFSILNHRLMALLFGHHSFKADAWPDLLNQFGRYVQLPTQVAKMYLIDRDTSSKLKHFTHKDLCGSAFDLGFNRVQILQ